MFDTVQRSGGETLTVKTFRPLLIFPWTASIWRQKPMRACIATIRFVDKKSALKGHDALVELLQSPAIGVNMAAPYGPLEAWAKQQQGDLVKTYRMYEGGLDGGAGEAEITRMVSQDAADWQATTETLEGSRTSRYTLTRDGRPASFGDVVNAWAGSSDFCDWWNTLLAESPFRAFRFETPPIRRGQLDRPFEFVLIDDPSLQRPADRHAFAEHYGDNPADHCAAFPNLRDDALLVVPAPVKGVDEQIYTHLAGFVREAPAAQKRVFWRYVAQGMNQRMSDDPVWLSTAGAGVAWLHVRIDDHPKYYRYQPYAQ